MFKSIGSRINLFFILVWVLLYEFEVIGYLQMMSGFAFLAVFTLNQILDKMKDKGKEEGDV